MPPDLNSGKWIVGTYYGHEGWTFRVYKTKEKAIDALKRNPNTNCEIFKRVELTIKEEENNG